MATFNELINGEASTLGLFEAMPRDMPPTSVIPVVGTKGTTSARVLVAEFGDGVTQRAPDGLNFVRQEWDLMWKHKQLHQYKRIRDFLLPRLGVQVFTWIPFGDDQEYDFVCTELSGITPESGQLYSWTATLRQEFV